MERWEVWGCIASGRRYLLWPLRLLILRLLYWELINPCTGRSIAFSTFSLCLQSMPSVLVLTTLSHSLSSLVLFFVLFPSAFSSHAPWDLVCERPEAQVVNSLRQSWVGRVRVGCYVVSGASDSWSFMWLIDVVWVCVCSETVAFQPHVPPASGLERLPVHIARHAQPDMHRRIASTFFSHIGKCPSFWKLRFITFSAEAWVSASMLLLRNLAHTPLQTNYVGSVR